MSFLFISGLLLIVIIIVSVAANGFVLVVKIKSHKFRSVHLFEIILLAADLVYSLMFKPMVVMTCFGLDPKLLFDNIGCNYFGFGSLFWGGLSIFVHSVIAYSKFKIITCPNEVSWVSTTKYRKLLIICVGITTIFAAAPIFGWNRYETFEFGCNIAFHDPSAICRSYVVVLLLLTFVLPFGISFYSYIQIVSYHYHCKLGLHQYYIDDHPIFSGTGMDEQSLSVMSIEGANSHPLLPSRPSVSNFFDFRVVGLTSISALLFFAAWSPFAVISILQMFQPPHYIPRQVVVFASLCAKASAALNPFTFILSKSFIADAKKVFNSPDSSG